MHCDLFPVDYEEAFFEKAVNFQSSIVSFVAVDAHEVNGRERIVGFISFRTSPLHTYDPFDRRVLGLDSHLLDGDQVAYILTLGVLPSHRKQGIASTLISQAIDFSSREPYFCRAVYLHVIDYNKDACRLYSAHGFSNLGRLSAFYDIRTGRQPDPNVVTYDALFYAKDIRGAQIQLTPGAIWNAMLLPFRPALYYLGACASAGRISIQGGAPNGFQHSQLGVAYPQNTECGQVLRQLFR
mmetsp:Transcript_14159/g.40134  ORF Transcript_14159/g.40134 Transcript_14159/m.40134 type:complete len:240 (-) Transcript_14159:164-883(-)